MHGIPQKTGGGEVQFVVEIERKETYHHRVVVDAKDEIEAKRKVMEFDGCNGFLEVWSESDFDVDTTYEATDAEMSCLPKEVIAEMERVP